MHNQKGPNAYEPDQYGGDGSNSNIGRHGTEPRLPAVEEQADRQPVLQDKQIGGTETEHDERVPVCSIAKTAPERAREIFAHRKGVDVADAASFKMARGGMMYRMGSTPEVIGRQRQYADHPAYPIVCQAMTKKGAMAAIMLNHEKSHEKASGGYCEQQ